MTTFSNAEIKALRRKPTAEERIEMHRRDFCDRVNWGRDKIYKSAGIFPNGDVCAEVRATGICVRIDAISFLNA